LRKGIVMLSEQELYSLCQRLEFSEEAQAVIRNIRASEPSRRVEGRAGNFPVRYASNKMLRTIQAESHRNELAGVREKEHDKNTLEYYDQPPPIKLEYHAKSGRKVAVLYTPDYFVIRKDSAGWEEWKLEEELVRLAEESPNRYVRGEDSRWHCPPAESYAEQFGFFFRIRSSAEINWVYQRNMLFLED
jgi:putative transposase